MSTQRPLTDEEQAELDALNRSVQQAIEARRAWLDAKMVETSRLQVGDDIYNVSTGHKVGTVSRLYRYHAGRDDRYDTSHYCSYEYASHPGCFDNTSRQTAMFGTREDAVQRAEYDLARLKRRAGIEP